MSSRIQLTASNILPIGLRLGEGGIPGCHIRCAGTVGARSSHSPRMFSARRLYEALVQNHLESNPVMAEGRRGRAAATWRYGETVCLHRRTHGEKYLINAREFYGEVWYDVLESSSEKDCEEPRKYLLLLSVII